MALIFVAELAAGVGYVAWLALTLQRQDLGAGVGGGYTVNVQPAAADDTKNGSVSGKITPAELKGMPESVWLERAAVAIYGARKRPLAAMVNQA
jgi:hypothetical protein